MNEFPVDTNVDRICTRLGWVPLQAEQALEELREYANAAEVYDYLKERLSTSFSVETLYELHYHMITLGKVFCAKQSPHCSACPARTMCEYSINNGKRLAEPTARSAPLLQSRLPCGAAAAATIAFWLLLPHVPAPGTAGQGNRYKQRYEVSGCIRNNEMSN